VLQDILKVYSLVPKPLYSYSVYISTQMIDIQQEIKKLVSDKVYKYIDSIGYFNSPASSSRHLCFEGGLALHSFNVYLVLKDMVDKYKMDITDNEVINISLLHDVCKCDGYIPNVLKNGSVSDKKPYKIEDKLPTGHGDKSVIMLLREGIELTDKEIMGIRYHMGSFSYMDSNQWSMANAMISKAGYWEVVMSTHIADMIASQLLEENELYTELYKSLYSSSA
jgi:hypothetical protein